MTTLNPRTATVVIYQGDDMNTLADLRRAADLATRIAGDAKESGSARVGDDDGSEAQAAKDAYDGFVDEAAERALLVVLHAIGRRRFRDLMAEHAPRMVTVTDDPDPEKPEAPIKERQVVHEDDAGYEVNTETFGQALLTFIDPDDPAIRTIAAPEFTSRKTVTEFLDDEIAEGDFNGLWVAAYYLNRMPSADPKSGRYSSARRSTDET